MLIKIMVRRSQEFCLILSLLVWISWSQTPKVASQPSHGRVFREKFHSVCVGNGV